jgi:hypothetical protein
LFSCRDETLHRDFIGVLGPVSIHVDDANKQLVVLSTDPEAITRAETVGDLHMKSISRKLNIRQRTDEARTKLEVSGADVNISSEFSLVLVISDILHV